MTPSKVAEKIVALVCLGTNNETEAKIEALVRMAQEPLSEKEFDKLRTAQIAIDMLESGEKIDSVSVKALEWAVMEVTRERFVSKEPLSKKDMEWAQGVAERYNSGDPKLRPEYK